MDEALFLFTVVYSIFLALNYGIDSILRALQQFKFQSFLQIVLAATITVVFFILVLATNNRTYQIYTLTGIVAMIVYTVLGFLINHNYLAIRDFSWRRLGTLSHYGIYCIIGSMAGFLLGNIDRIMLNSFIGPAAVGIYAAYFSASMAIVGQGLQIFLNVFFPTVAQNIDRRAVITKIKKAFRVALVPLILISFFTTWIVINLYGDKYPVDFWLMGLFAINAGLYLIGTVQQWFIASFSIAGVRFSSHLASVTALLNFLLNLVGIHYWGIYGAVVATLFATCCFIIMTNRFLRNNVWMV